MERKEATRTMDDVAAVKSQYKMKSQDKEAFFLKDSVRPLSQRDALPEPR